MRLSPWPLLLLVAGCGSTPGASHAGDGGRDASPPEDAAEASAPDVYIPPQPEGGGCASPGAVWIKMDNEPIVLSNPMMRGHTLVGGVDLEMAGGLTIGEAEVTLCPGTPFIHGENGAQVEAWGISNEFRLLWVGSRQQVVEAELLSGYLGKMTLPTDPKGPDAGHSFTVGVGEVLRDGEVFTIDWMGTAFTNGNQLYNAISYNAADYPGYGTSPCKESGACSVDSSGTDRQWNIAGVGVTLHFALDGTAEQQSSVTEIDFDVP